MLHGVAAAATGLIAATWFQIGKKTVKGFYEAFFILAAILGINYFKLSVPVVLLAVGAVAIFTYRPRKPVPHRRGGSGMDQIPAIAGVFSYLSLLTIGGGMAAFPEMKVLVVDVHHWLTYRAAHPRV